MAWEASPCRRLPAGENDRGAMPRGPRAPGLDAPRVRDGDERPLVVHCGLRGWQGDVLRLRERRKSDLGLGGSGVSDVEFEARLFRMAVYFIKDEHDRVKIGCAKDPQKRCLLLQAGNA